MPADHSGGIAETAMQAIPFPVYVHFTAALSALALGIVMLVRRKGTASHKRLGWAYIAAIAAVAVSSLWIPGFLKFTWIHAINVITIVSLPLTIVHIRRGNVRAHAGAMKGLFIGGLLIAGGFALVPGRLLGNLVWHGVFGYL
jgi:uncharacterized membrane protein